MAIMLKRFSVIIAAFVLGYAAPALQALGEATPNIHNIETLDVRGDRLFIPIEINGRRTEALLDSGAEMTFVDEGFAAEIGLALTGSEIARGTGGEEPVRFAEGVIIAAAGVRLENRTVAVLDLSDISSRLIGSPLKVVLGREFFDSTRIEIDIKAGVIRAVDRSKTPPGVKLHMETHDGLQTLPVYVEGVGPVQASFDLGNGNEVLIGAAFAERAGLLDPERVIRQKTGGGIGGEILRDIVLLSRLDVASVAFYDIEAAVDTTDSADDANLGVRILRHFKMTVDFEEQTIWLDQE